MQEKMEIERKLCWKGKGRREEMATRRTRGALRRPTNRRPRPHIPLRQFPVINFALRWASPRASPRDWVKSVLVYLYCSLIDLDSSYTPALLLGRSTATRLKLAIVAFLLFMLQILDSRANKSINAASSNCPSRNNLLFGQSRPLQCAIGAHPSCSPHTTCRRTNNEQLTVLASCFSDVRVSRCG